VHDVVVVVVSGAYVVFNLMLALVLAVTLLLGGASLSTLVVFALVWLVPTYLYVRFRRR
jgi:O-antigen/teichoic acid export membrane protein